MLGKKILIMGGILLVLVAGTAVVSAQDLSDDAPRGNWDPTTSTGEIILDDGSYYRVYQGESDITRWRNVEGDDVTGEVLERSTGGNTVELRRSVSRNQRTGRYATDDGSLTARVVEPEVTFLDAFSRRGVRLSDDSGVSRTSPILIRGEWNFVEAEDLRIVVRDRDGVEVTREVLTTDVSSEQADLLPSGFSESFLDRRVQGAGSTGYSTAYWAVDPDTLRAGTHEIRVEGVEDLDFGRATDRIRLSVGDEVRPSLTFDRTTVSQGETARFTVRGGEVGEYYAVGVPMRSVRGVSDPDDVFRFIGDTREVGSTGNFAYAIVRISDRGTAIGGIDTAHVERGSVSVRLFRGGDSVEQARNRIGDEEESRSLTVERSDLSHSLAAGTYVTGQSIDVSGTASPGVRRVAMYVRDRDDWEILPLNGRDTTTVRADGTWVARNVVLSDEEYGGRNFRFPGTYSIAVVDAADLSSPPPRTISPSEFNRLTTSRSTTRVNEPAFVANIRSYAGEVAHGDRVFFSGTSVGPREIVVGFVGDRDVRAEVVRTTSGNTISTNIDLDGMRRGEVTAFAISPGRDREFGDGRATDAQGNTVSIRTTEQFADYVRSFDGDGRTRAQRMSRIRAATVDRAGSDDLMRTTNFRITDARSTVRDIVPGGQPELAGIVPIEQTESVLVRGTTNRNPSDTDLVVEIVDGPDAAEFDVRTIRSWSGGTWSATFSTEGISTGTYTVRVDDGVSTDTRSFTIVEDRELEPDELETLRERLNEIRDELALLEGQNEELRDRVTELEEERDRLQQELEEAREEPPVEDDEEDDEPPEEEAPGFTALAALAALVALAVLVAVRRRN